MNPPALENSTPPANRPARGPRETPALAKNRGMRAGPAPPQYDPAAGRAAGRHHSRRLSRFARGVAGKLSEIQARVGMGKGFRFLAAFTTIVAARGRDSHLQSQGSRVAAGTISRPARPGPTAWRRHG